MTVEEFVQTAHCAGARPFMASSGAFSLPQRYPDLEHAGRVMR